MLSNKKFLFLIIRIQGEKLYKSLFMKEYNGLHGAVAAHGDQTCFIYM